MFDLEFETKELILLIFLHMAYHPPYHPRQILSFCTHHQEHFLLQPPNQVLGPLVETISMLLSKSILSYVGIG